MIEHQPLDVYVINTHSLHNAHLLRRALPRDLVAPVPFIDPSQRQAEHAKFAAAWRENPKSQTARERARVKKDAEKAAKDKKRKPQGNKHSADGVYGWESLVPKEEMKEEMVLVSELDVSPPFLAGVYNNVGNSQLGFEVAGLDP